MRRPSLPLVVNGEDVLDDDLYDAIETAPEDEADEEASLQQFLQDMEPEGEPLPEPGSDEPERLWNPSSAVFSGSELAAEAEQFPYPQQDAMRTQPMVPSAQDTLAKFESFDDGPASGDEQTWLHFLAQTAVAAPHAMHAAGLVAAMPAIAMRTQPQVYRALWPAVPALTPAVMHLARQWYGRARTRPYLQYLPQILMATAETLAKQIQQGRRLRRTEMQAVFRRHVRSALPRRSVHRPGKWGTPAR